MKAYLKTENDKVIGCVIGSGIKPIGYDLTVEDSATLPSGHIDYWVVINGIISQDEEVKQASEESERLVALELEAQAYQDSIVSKNEASAILGRTVSEMKIKARANYDWIQSLWGLYYVKKADATNDTAFDSIGPKPYSFVELQLEETEA